MVELGDIVYLFIFYSQCQWNKSKEVSIRGGGLWSFGVPAGTVCTRCSLGR